MAITAEMVKEFANEPAVFSNIIAAGTEIEPKHIEHPMFLPDMVSSNLFTLEEALTIGQVVGIKTARDCDALTPVTEEAVGGAVKLEKKEVEVQEEVKEEAQEEAAPVKAEYTVQDGNTIIISIKEGKDIYLELPL